MFRHPFFDGWIIVLMPQFFPRPSSGMGNFRKKTWCHDMPCSQHLTPVLENLVQKIWWQPHFFPATKSERLQRSLWIYPVDVGSWAAGVTWIGADVLRWFLLGLESLESLELGFCGLGQSWLDLFVDVLRWRYVYMYNLTDVHYMYICAYIAVCEVLFLASNCLAWLVLPPWMWHCQKQQLTAIPELVCWLAWQQQITWSWTSCDVYIQFILVW